MADTTLVTYGKPKTGGAISVAALGTALPTSADEDLDASFVSLGYISDEGLSNSNSPETSTIYAWGGDPVLTTQESKEDTFSFKLIEAKNEEVLKVVYGDDNVSGTLSTGIAVKANATELEAKSWVVDMIFTDDCIKRIVIPNGKVTEIGEIAYTDGEAAGYEITVTASSDDDGQTHYEYILDTSAAAS